MKMPMATGRSPTGMVAVVSQRELGNMTAGSRESVNRHLQIWHREGLIDLSKGSIMIRDVEAIQRLI
jgi:CRP/FNR family cyclic AMP-dependent transcriptional regulator